MGAVMGTQTDVGGIGFALGGGSLTVHTFSGASSAPPGGDASARANHGGNTPLPTILAIAVLGNHAMRKFKPTPPPRPDLLK